MLEMGWVVLLRTMYSKKLHADEVLHAYFKEMYDMYKQEFTPGECKLVDKWLVAVKAA